MLSFHGEFSLAYICSQYPEFIDEVLSSGFFDRLIAEEVYDQIKNPTYHRHTYLTNKFANDIFARSKFSIEDIKIGIVSRFQNLAILRK